MNRFFFQKQILWFLAFSIAVLLGLYFRTYSLHQIQTPPPEKMAAIFVERVLTKQFESALAAQSPTLSGDDKLKLAHEQAQRMIESDPANYQKAFKQALDRINEARPHVSDRHYLLEADPYYYFYLTEQIIQNGKIAQKIKGGEYFHTLMHAPYGYWTAMTWHPYLGYGIGRVVHLFSPQMNWMETLCWVPLVLSVLACMSFFFLARALQMEFFQVLIGGLALMLSPIFMQRSGYGWYDTDPYNYIFPFLILGVVLTGLRSQKWAARYAVLSGFLTGLYSMFWTGWAFMFLLVPTALLAAYIAARYVFRVHPKPLSIFLKYGAIHFAASGCFAALFLTPHGLCKSISLGWEILRKFSLSDGDVWPNIFLTVGEARGASLKKLIYLSGNYITFGIAVFGLLRCGLKVYTEKKSENLAKWLFLFIFSIPLFVLPFKTERFAVLFVVPLCIWVMYGACEAQEQLKNLFKKIIANPTQEGLLKKLSAGVIMLVFLPLPLITGHLVSLGTKPIMDDAWFDTMQELRQKTPENAVVNSWWPPGYFISALAHRRVIVDGGTQHLQEAYWVARILAAQDEKEAGGLLRMLNQTGNDALLFLKGFGVEISDAIDLISSVVSVPREQAMKLLPPDMPQQVKNRFLDLTHGTGKMPASYVLVYSDLIEQNLAVTMIARWNFKKAREAKTHRSSNYAQDFMSMTNGVLKYMPAAGVQKQEGKILFFSSGLMINLDLMDAVISSPQKNIHGRPVSLFFMKDGNLEEKVFEGPRVDMSALLVHDRDGSYRAVLADARLIRSLLFRLYYLNGEGLSYFKPFSRQKNPLDNNEVSVFEFKNEAFQS